MIHRFPPSDTDYSQSDCPVRGPANSPSPCPFNRLAGDFSNKAIYGLSRVILGGGVSANSALRQEMTRACQEAGAELFLAPPAYCTDNAAMVAGLAYHKLQAGLTADLGLTARA